MPTTVEVLAAAYFATGICLARHELLTCPSSERPGVLRLNYIAIAGPAILLWAIVSSIPDFGKDAPAEDDDGE